MAFACSIHLVVFLVNCLHYHRLELHHFHKVLVFEFKWHLLLHIHNLHKFSDLNFIFRWILFEPTVRCIWHNNGVDTNILHLISWHQLCYSNSIHIFTCKSSCDAIKLSSKMKCFLRFQHYYRSMLSILDDVFIDVGAFPSQWYQRWNTTYM